MLLSTGLNHTSSAIAPRFYGILRARPAEIFKCSFSYCCALKTRGVEVLAFVSITIKVKVWSNQAFMSKLLIKKRSFKKITK